MNREAFTVSFVVAVLLTATAGGAAVQSTVPASGDISMQTNSGLVVTVEGASEVPEQPFADDQTVQLESGTVSAPADSNVTLPQATLNGSYTRLDQINATGTTVTVNPGDKPQFAVGGDIERINVSETIAVDDGQPDFEYGGASGTSNVTVRTLPPDTVIKAVDVDSGTLLDATRTDGNGVAAFTALDNSNHTVALTDDNTAPTVDNPDPDGTVSTLPTTLEADVDDADFSEGDSVEVRISVNGNLKQTTTITSRQTVSYTLNSAPNGTNQWTVNATDASGQSTIKSYSVDVPGRLRIYNQSSPDTLISAGGNVTFYNADGDKVEIRDISGGTVDLQGLPVASYTAVVEADGYYQTPVYIRDLAGNHSAYVLPADVSTSEIVFELDDSTGRFRPDDSTLSIQRALNVSGTVEYRTVVSDEFDASGQLPADLINDERYRLVIRNDEGETRVLGSYTPTQDALVELPIGNVVLVGDTQDDTAFAAQLEETTSGRVIRTQYRDPQDRTTELRVTIYEYGNQSNVLVDNQSISGPFGTATATFDVPSSAPDDVSYRVEYEAIRSPGDDATGEALVGDIPPVAQQFALAPGVLSLLGWATIILTTGLVTIASAQLATVVAVLVATLMTFIGAVAIPAPLLGVAGAMAFLTNFGRLRQ